MQMNVLSPRPSDCEAEKMRANIAEMIKMNEMLFDMKLYDRNKSGNCIMTTLFEAIL